MWGKYGAAGQATYGNKIRRNGFAYLLPEATKTHSEYAKLLLFHRKNGNANVPQCQVCKYVACLVILHQFRQDNTQLVVQITFSN